MAVTRSFPGRRRVHLGDVAASGRLRLDAAARYLQDIATDDAADVGLADGWVLRRTTMHFHRFPRFRDEVDLVTWCSGTSSTAAERCTVLSLPEGPALESVALWAFVGADGRPQRLDVESFARLGIPKDAPRVATRLHHPDPPEGASGRPWPLRLTDVDLLGHVNNAVTLAAFEEVLAEHGRTLAVPCTVEVEYRMPLLPDDEPEVVTDVASDGTLWSWIRAGGAVRTSSRHSGSRV
ncbi:MAG: acyl-ACP thioesterase domain-containing protein [Actinomycetes bacterium]